MRWTGIKARLETLIFQINRKEKGFILGFLSIVLCLGGVGCIISTADSCHVYSKSKLTQTEITAHRGYSSIAPENTLPAFLLAVDSKADYVELDVQKTKDGVPIVFHDQTLKRMIGINKRITELTYEELLQIDLGSGYEERFFGTSIPTLEEVLQACQGNIKFNVELKSPDKELVQLVLNLLEAYQLIDESVITSTDYQALKWVKEYHPSMMTGYIISIVYGDLEQLECVDVLSIKSKYINAQLVKQIHQSGKLLYAWTVNDADEIKRLLYLGVDNIITDEIEKVIEVKQSLLEEV